MKKYLGKKEVMASPMSMGEAYDRGLLQSNLKSSRVDKDKEGYLVKYDNGYQSWSPKDVFDNSYKVVDTPLDRLYLECNELSDKYNKLVFFLEKEGAKEFVGDVQFGLMEEQRDLMKGYIDILKERIELLK